MRNFPGFAGLAATNVRFILQNGSQPLGIR